MSARRQAALCLSAGMQPSEFKQLTRVERDAFWTAIKQANKKK